VSAGVLGVLQIATWRHVPESFAGYQPMVMAPHASGMA
jgi:hypothetical protein